MQALTGIALRAGPRACRLALPEVTCGVSRAGRPRTRSTRAAGEAGNGAPPAQESSSPAAAPARDPSERGPAGGPRGEAIKVCVFLAGGAHYRPPAVFLSGIAGGVGLPKFVRRCVWERRPNGRWLRLKM